MEKVMRNIVQIDESKCDGCGLCIPSCAEGALQIVDGKAKLVKDVYCDGLGACLGECPQDAISIIEREAEPFDEEAVEEFLKSTENNEIEHDQLTVGCPSCTALGDSFTEEKAKSKRDKAKPGAAGPEQEAELTHWPIQLHLVAPEARFFQDSDLLIAADCVPFAYPAFHSDLLAERSLVIGCPKLDDVNLYQAKLTEIFKRNSIKSITLAHMEVGCCFGLSSLVNEALKASGKAIPLEEIIIGVDGTIKQ